MDIYLWLWLGWFALFFAIEIPAMRDARRGGTLSEKVWLWLAIGQPWTRGRQIRRIAFIAFMAWLVIHFFTGGWI